MFICNGCNLKVPPNLGLYIIEMYLFKKNVFKFQMGYQIMYYLKNILVKIYLNIFSLEWQNQRKI